MVWVGDKVIRNKPLQIFHCETCDKYAASLPGEMPEAA
jgi:uncharacterized protein YlaI